MMKRIIISLLAALIAVSAYAVPAWPGVIRYQQPDGSVVSIQLHGDEFFSWATLAGTKTVVDLDEKGFWRPSQIDRAARQAAMKRRDEVNRKRAPRRSSAANDPMTHGERHIPVFLVSFPGVPFSIESPLERFSAMLNENGYSSDGATGSVCDYYVDNSHGAFKPVFDLYGPVELPNEMSYYGAHKGNAVDSNPGMALYHAALALDDVVDFSRYDYDNDGVVDMTLFYYSGYSEAEGGNMNTIWPHSSSVSGEAGRARFDGKRLGSYFCTAELKGNSGNRMCGIGATCHEFAHSLGLPDFYDTNYEENGSAGGLYSFSLMCNGCYNNVANTPPYLNAEERIMLGWMGEEDVIEIPEGSVSFPSIDNNVAYKSLTDTEGEYFLYECRDGQGWDAPLPSGMVVYHVDKSTDRYVLGVTPYEQWTNWLWYNSINADGSHPCFYIVPSSAQKSLNYTGKESAMVFPGTKSVTSYKPVDWDGNDTGISITGISYGSGTVSLSAAYDIQKKIKGVVSDQYGNPVQGVYVVMSQPSSSGAPFRKVPRKNGSRAFETLTGQDGSFEISLDDFKGSAAHLSFSKGGFKTSGLDIDIKPRLTKVTFTLLRIGEPEKIDYSWYDPTGSLYIGGDGVNSSQMAAIRIPTEQLPSEGGSVVSVTFYPIWYARAYYIIMDSGNERIFTHRIDVPRPGDLMTISLDDVDASFPAGQDLYIGYAVENAQTYKTEDVDYTGLLFVLTDGASNCYYSKFDLNGSSWEPEEEGYALVLSATVMPKSSGPDPGEPEVESLADMGFNSIADPNKGLYQAGDSFQLDLDLAPGVTAQSVTWLFDGSDVTGAKSVRLESGRHTITATLTTSDGSIELLELVLEV